MCYNVIVQSNEGINRLKQHVASLKRLCLEHLFMLSSTARGVAKEREVKSDEIKGG
ncbi:MAG: hypothetical protein H7844_00365 [Nitrospirae bacterium YQR-1]